MAIKINHETYGKPQFISNFLILLLVTLIITYCKVDEGISEAKRDHKEFKMGISEPKRNHKEFKMAMVILEGNLEYIW